MLVHEPREEPPERPAWSPNWRLWAWVLAAVVVGFAASSTDGAIGFALLMGSFAAACRAVTVALPYGGGLTDWRQ